MRRVEFIKAISMLAMAGPVNDINDLLKLSDNLQYVGERLPVFFFGHGDPDNAFKENAFTKQIREMGKSLPFKPSAVLVISGHYLSTSKSYLKIQPHFESHYYPVNGAIDFGKTIIESYNFHLDSYTDLDHGAWIILNHLFPEKDVPVMELSIPMEVSVDYHWQLAHQLKPLRDKGILVIGSGNVVHNLNLSLVKMFLLSRKPFHWAIEMDEWIKSNIDNRNWYNLLNYHSKGKAAKLAINTADHYIPALYILGMTYPKENIVHTYEEVYSAVSMRCFRSV